jgi:hypothetical protein
MAINDGYDLLLGRVRPFAPQSADKSISGKARVGGPEVAAVAANARTLAIAPHVILAVMVAPETGNQHRMDCPSARTRGPRT